MQSIRRISSAHVIALLALFVALGGSAYAIHLARTQSRPGTSRTER